MRLAFIALCSSALCSPVLATTLQPAADEAISHRVLSASRAAATAGRKEEAQQLRERWCPGIAALNTSALLARAVCFCYLLCVLYFVLSLSPPHPPPACVL